MHPLLLYLSALAHLLALSASQCASSEYYNPAIEECLVCPNGCDACCD